MKFTYQPLLSNTEKMGAILIIIFMMLLTWSHQVMAITYGEMSTEKLTNTCDQNDAAACLLLGSRYVGGDRVSRPDGEKASLYYKKSCSLGQGLGCDNLAVMLAKGTMIPEDKLMSAQYRKKACELGAEFGCFIYGYLLEKGTVIEKDIKQAALYYRKACDKDVGRACENLASLYGRGEGVVKDDAADVSLREKACSLGAGESCGILATVYLSNKNSTKAFALATNGCKAGDNWSCEILKKINNH